MGAVAALLEREATDWGGCGPPPPLEEIDVPRPAEWASDEDEDAKVGEDDTHESEARAAVVEVAAEVAMAREMAPMQKREYEVLADRSNSNQVSDGGGARAVMRPFVRTSTAAAPIKPQFRPHLSSLISSSDDEEEEGYCNAVCDGCTLQFYTASGKALCIDCRPAASPVLVPAPAPAPVPQLQSELRCTYHHY